MDSGKFALAVEHTIEFLRDRLARSISYEEAAENSLDNDLLFYLRIKILLLTKGFADALYIWESAAETTQQRCRLLKFVNPDDFDFLFSRWVHS